MESNKKNKNENCLPTINNKNNQCINGGININNKQESSRENISAIDNTNFPNINLFPKNLKKISISKADNTNNSYIAIRKNSDFGPKKKNDITITQNENNNNMISLSNLSNSNLLQNKNESIFRKINKKGNLKDEESNPTINQINNIYDNKFSLKLRLNKDDIIQKNKISNKYINRNFEKLKNFKKLRKNHYTLIKSKTFNDNKRISDVHKRNSSNILQKFCFICYSYDDKLYHTKNCNHFFCKECGRNYFEQQVQRIIYTLKCPKYNCNNNLNLNSIKEILSKEAFIKLETYEKLNNNLNKRTSVNLIEKMVPNLNAPNSNKRNSFETISHESFKGLNCLKRNFFKIPKGKKHKNNHNTKKKKHILKIDSNTKFKTRILKENEKNKIICSKCKKPSLFKRDDLTYIRCLNCDNIFCKFCLKKFNNAKRAFKRHYICGSCYSKRKKRPKLSFITKMKYEILLVFSGIFFVLIGFSKYEVEFILKKKTKCFVLYMIIFFVVFIFNSIIAILLFPYFPVITLLFP